MAEHSGQFIQPVRIETFQSFGDPPMQLPPVGFHQRGIRGFLHQRVPEEVFEFRLYGGEADEAGGFEGGEVGDKRH